MTLKPGYIRFAFLSILVVSVVFTQFYWLGADSTPQRWDESIHLTSSLNFSQAMKISPLAAMSAFIKQEAFYPPLIPFLGAFFGLINPSEDGFTMIMALFTAAIIIFTFLYARLYFDDISACAAAVIVTACPIVFREAHYFMLDVPITAFFIASLYMLERTQRFTKKPWIIALGITAGMALLVKWTFVIYFAAPLIITVAEAAGEKAAGSKKNMLLSMAAALVIAAPWYIYNSFSIVMKLLKYSFNRGVTENLPGIFTPQGLIYYIQLLPVELTWMFCAVFIAGAALLIAEKGKRKLLLVFIIPLIFFTLLHNKKDRYIMPLMPAAAVIASYAVYALKSNRFLKTALASFIVASGVVIYVSANYIMPFNIPENCRPSSADWHIKDFLSRVKPGSTLAVVPDSPYMNNPSYNFHMQAFYPELKLTGIFNFPMFTDYFLVKTGDVGPEFSGADKRRQILAEAQDPKSGLSKIFEKVYEVRLPDKSTGMLFKRKDAIETGPGYRDSLNGRIIELMSQYLKDLKKFRFNVAFDNATVSSLKVGFEEGFAGDFKHKDKGLLIKNADIIVRDLLPEPTALKQGKLKMLSLGSVEIKSLEVDAADLKNFIQLYAKKLDRLEVAFDKGLINISGVYSKVPVVASLSLFNPAPGTDRSDIIFKFVKLKVYGIPVPAGFVNFLLKDYNPLLNKSNSPVKLKFGEIKVLNGRLTIGD